MIKRSLLAGLALAALCSSALAQVNVVPQVGVTTNYLARQTYTAGFIGLVPPASATDLICISGSASKLIRLQSLKISGTAGTLVTLPLTVLRRASVDTGGTAATTTANPANTISKRDTTNGAATATLISYTAVPTINDTSPTYIDSQSATLNLTGTTAAGVVPTEFNYGRDVENFLQAPVLRGVAQQICLNLNTISVSSGVLNGTIVWTEE